jgi:hypothetical protein
MAGEQPYQRQALEQFILQTLTPIEGQLDQYQKFAKSVQRSVRGIRQVVRRMFGNALAKLLRTCRIEYSPPHIGAPGSDAIASASRLLRSQWNAQIGPEQQALLSIHSDESLTTIQVGSGTLGSAYITFDGKFDPIALAEKFMALVSPDLEALFHPDGVVTVYDGDMNELNPKQFLKKHRIVRSRRDNFEGVKERLAHVISAPAPRPEDTAIHFGVPEDAAQLESVFASSSEDDEPQVWAEWSPIAPLWKEISEQHGFTDHLRSTDAEVLQSLATKRNVIIVVAHAEGKAIHLPAPPPKGSTISSDELQAHRDAIAENNPMVYLFCCEAAKIDGITSFVDELLDCGARAVVAPQTKIGAISSARLFDQFLAGGKSELSMLSSLQRAEEISEYREMETWIG